MDWNAIFHKTWFETDERDYIVNKRHAELLSKDPVPLTYLKKIIFRCEADLKRAMNLFGNDERFTVNSSLFSDKNKKRPKDKYNNFIKDYRIGFNNKGNKIDLVLYFDLNYTDWKEEYDFKYEILDYLGREINVRIEVDNLNNKSDSMLDKMIKSKNPKKVKFYDFKDDWKKIKVSMNGYLCIEELLKEFNKEIRIINKASLLYEKSKESLLENNTRSKGIMYKINQRKNNTGFIKLHEELNKQLSKNYKNHYVEFVDTSGNVDKKEYIEINLNEKIVDIKLECLKKYKKIRRCIGNTLCYEIDLDDIRNNEEHKIMFLDFLV